MAATSNHVFDANKDYPLSHFYRLEKNGRILYILGTIHIFSFKKLHPLLQNSIRVAITKSRKMFTEGVFTPFTLDNLQKTDHFLKERQRSVWDQLLPKEQKVLLPVINAIKQRHNIEFDLKRLSAPAIHHFMIENLWHSGMDTDLQIEFSNCLPIEGLRDDYHEFDDQSLLGTILAQTVEELRDYIRDYDDPNSSKLLEEKCSNYLSGQPQILDNDEEQIKEVQTDNIIFFGKLNKFLSYGQDVMNGVVVVGAAHLYTSLLALFFKEGYSISRADNHGKFYPCQMSDQAPFPVVIFSQQHIELHKTSMSSQSSFSESSTLTILQAAFDEFEQLTSMSIVTSRAHAPILYHNKTRTISEPITNGFKLSVEEEVILEEALASFDFK